jgi:iron complex outermembrane receptor protein
VGRFVCRRWSLFAGAAILAVPAETVAQQVEPATNDDVVVVGKRMIGSAIGDTDPVAVLDAAAIRALGVTNITDMLRLLRPLTTSASGADPVFLLNGRRVSGYGEIQSLPPEALAQTEVLPETEAARFGFPSTVRLVNFITKKHFRSLSVEQGAGTTTEGGGSTALAQIVSTRIDGPRRTSLTIGYDRQDPLRGTRRFTVPDSSGLFDSVGNIVGIGGSIDPALDALAGRPVTTAAVPLEPASRGLLAGYVAGANAPRVTNLAAFQSIEGRDTLKVDGTQALPIGRTVMASLNLTMEAQRSDALAGLGSAVLRVGVQNPAVPFARDVLLYRYLPEAGALRRRAQSLNLHAGGTVQGSLKRWLWTLTGNYDRSRVNAAVDQGIVTGPLQAAIDAGGDPFAPLSAAESENRIVSRARSVTQTATGNATATGPVFALPAGDVRMTLTGDLARSTSSSASSGAIFPAVDVGRTTRAASVNLDLPITSASRGVLDAIGTLSANGTIGVSSVSAYGSLVNSAVGFTWSPVVPLQFTGSVTTSQTAPAISQLTNPVVSVPNAPFFDFVTGTSVLASVIAGGNTALLPERRRISTIGTSYKPFKARELRFNLDYVETRITGQVGNIGSVTPALQAAFPDRFVRDANGRLFSVDLRPVNLLRERERKVQAKVSLFMQLGPEPKPPQAPPAKDAPPPPPPKARPMIYSFLAGTVRLDDILVLRSGQPRLDLLGGDSIDGTGGRPRYEVQGNLGGSLGPFNGGVYAQWQASTRIRSDIASADLSFSGKTYLGFYSTFDAAKLAPRALWAQKMTFQLQLQNILNDRIAVRDRNGATPYRFQPAFLDPYGRLVKLSVRKVF